MKATTDVSTPVVTGGVELNDDDSSGNDDDRSATADALADAVLGVHTAASVADDQIINSLEQPFDGCIDVREVDDGYELNVRGLADQPTGWQSI